MLKNNGWVIRFIGAVGQKPQHCRTPQQHQKATRISNNPVISAEMMKNSMSESITGWLEMVTRSMTLMFSTIYYNGRLQNVLHYYNSNLPRLENPGKGLNFFLFTKARILDVLNKVFKIYCLVCIKNAHD